MTRHNSPQESPDNFARHVRIDQCDSDNINNNNNFYLSTLQIKANTADRAVQILKYIILIKNLYLKDTEILVLSRKKILSII